MDYENLDCSDFDDLDVDGLDINGKLFWTVYIRIVNSWITLAT